MYSKLISEKAYLFCIIQLKTGQLPKFQLMHFFKYGCSENADILASQENRFNPVCICIWFFKGPCCEFVDLIIQKKMVSVKCVFGHVFSTWKCMKRQIHILQKTMASLQGVFVCGILKYTSVNMLIHTLH